MEVGKWISDGVLLAKLSVFWGVAAGFLFGTWSPPLTALGVFFVLDIATGMIASAIEAKQGKGKGLSSSRGMVGILKKVVLMLFIIVGHFVDHALELKDVMRNAIVYGLMSIELVSIVENAGRSGVTIPTAVTKVIAVLKDKSESAGG